MKEGSKIPATQREKDDALMDFVCRQAQEAILDPNVPDSYKDFVLDAAITTIRNVAERKAAYFAKHGAGRLTRKAK